MLVLRWMMGFCRLGSVKWAQWRRRGEWGEHQPPGAEVGGAVLPHARAKSVRPHPLGCVVAAGMKRAEQRHYAANRLCRPTS